MITTNLQTFIFLISLGPGIVILMIGVQLVHHREPKKDALRVRAEHVWALEKEFGMIPSSWMGFEPKQKLSMSPRSTQSPYDLNYPLPGHHIEIEHSKGFTQVTTHRGPGIPGAASGSYELSSAQKRVLSGPYLEKTGEGDGITQPVLSMEHRPCKKCGSYNICNFCASERRQMWS